MISQRMFGRSLVASAIVLGSFLVVLSACHQEGPKSAATTASTSPPTCALGVAGASVTVEDIEAGVIMDFAAAPDARAELRQRARNAAELHGAGWHLGEGHEGHHGDHGGHGLRPQDLPPATAVASDSDPGARIRLTPIDAKDRDLLRARVRERAEAMSHECK